MGMPRERKVLVGLGAVALLGRGLDKAFLSSADAAAPAAAQAEAGLGSTTQSAVNAVAGRLQGGLRDAMTRMLEKHVAEAMPQMDFGPDPAWMQRLVAQTPLPDSAEPAPAAPRSVMTGVLPGLSGRPTLTLVMPTRSGGGVAVIDGHRLSVGQTHPDGYTLEAVHERSVTIAKDGATATLALPSPGN